MGVAEEGCFAVWMYGSRARGDYDEVSDLDIFVAGQPSEGFVLKDLYTNGVVPSASQYVWPEIEAMASCGSLFLHHLRLEGKPLVESQGGHAKLMQLLEGLPRYCLYRRDIKAFHLTVADVQDAAAAGSTPEFELSVFGTVVRHSSILACYLLGSPCFSRYWALERASAAFGFSNAAAEGLHRLYRFRLHEDGRCSAPFQASWREVEHWSAQVKRFLRHLQEVADAFEERLSEVNRESTGQRCRS